MTDEQIEQRVTEIMARQDEFTKLCIASLGSTEIVHDAKRLGYCAGAGDAYKDFTARLEEIA